jgi:hypothetical protein
MAKTKISEFSATSADNTDITNINIAEGCSPSNVNNAIRSLMSVLKNFEDGSSGDSLVVGGNLSVTGTTTLTGTAIAPTPSSSDNSTKIATTAFVQTKFGTLGTMSTQNATAVAITGGTITGITDLTVPDGGTGASSITANSVVLGNGTSALSGNLVAPSTSGNVLTSNGTTWTSAALDFDKSLTANGYQKLPSGLIMQWGSYSSLPIAATAVTLPIAFPNAGLFSVVNIAETSSTDRFAPKSTLSTTQITLVNKDSGPYNVTWFAIGY